MAPVKDPTTSKAPAPIAVLAVVDLAVPFGYQWFPVVKPDSARVPAVQRT